LSFAAKSLVNLQEVYNLAASKLADGMLGGTNTGAKLTHQDLFYLGSSAANSKKHNSAVEFLEHAIRMFEKQNATSENNENRRKVENLLYREQGMVKPVTHRRSVLGQVPPKTGDYSKMTTNQDKLNYQALCQGKDLLPEDISKRLQCFYSIRNDPYYIIHPIALEEIHPAPHQILLFHHVMDDVECDQVASLAGDKMKQSGIGVDKQVSDLRLSQSHWIEDRTNKLVDKLSERMNWITGLRTSAMFDKGAKKEEYEYLQIGSYGTGGYYDVHQDPLFVYKDHHYIASSVEPSRLGTYPTGDRMSTLMFYLSHTKAGGYTVFPRLGVAVRPEKGSAILWHNIQEDGWSDMMMLHGGCPVILGRKIVANKWIREVANMFTRPCKTEPNVHSYKM